MITIIIILIIIVVFIIITDPNQGTSSSPRLVADHMAPVYREALSL